MVLLWRIRFFFPVSPSIIHNPATLLDTHTVIIGLNMCPPHKRGWFCSPFLGVLSTWFCGWHIICAQQLSFINKLSTSYVEYKSPFNSWVQLLRRNQNREFLKSQLLLKFSHCSLGSSCWSGHLWSVSFPIFSVAF